MAETVASGAAAAPGVFSRKASGLVRVGNTLDVFIFNVGLVSVGIAIAYNQFYGPSLYPGAQPWISTLLAALGMIFVAAAFYCWSVVFPRSGGVYVFLSRTINPGVAFVMSLIETIILLYYAALAAGLIVQVGLSSFFTTVGQVSFNTTMLQLGPGRRQARRGVLDRRADHRRRRACCSRRAPGGTSRSSAFCSWSRWSGLAVVAGVMLFGSRSGFSANLTTYTGLHYQQVIASARKKGFAAGGTSFSASWKFIVWPLLPLLGAVQSVGIGGEVKKVSRSQLFGMLGAVIATGLVIALFALLSNKDFGYTFQGAVAFNALSGVGARRRSTAPWFAVLAGILGHNVFLSVVILATFAAWIWFWIPAEMAYTTRSMIAWSFDRVAPDKLGFVSETVHTPVVAIGVSTAGRGRLHVADRVQGRGVPHLHRGAARGLGHGHGRGRGLPAAPQAALRVLASEELPAARHPGHAGGRRDLGGVHGGDVLPALDGRHRRRALVQAVQDAGGVLDHARRRRGRRRLVPVDQGVPQAARHQHQARVPADPDRMTPDAHAAGGPSCRPRPSGSSRRRARPASRCG